MGIGWLEIATFCAYVPMLVISVLLAGVAYDSARIDFKKAGKAFLAFAFAIFWAFKGYSLTKAVFSGDIFAVEYWSWFVGRSFDFSLDGLANFCGITGSCLAFVVGYAIIVALTIWNVPTLGRSRSELKINAALFVAVLGLDYAWLDKAPGLLF